jgi:hypothetical protein
VQEQPQAEALVLLAAQARLAADRVALPGGGSAEVVEDEDGDQVVQVTGGRVRPDELVRGVLRTPGFSPRGDAIDLVVLTDRGWDRHVLAADLATRLLHARHDEQRVAAGGRHVVVLGPPAGDPLTSPAPSGAGLAVARLVDRSSIRVGQLTELPLVADPTLTDAAGRRPVVLGEADLVVASWGVVGPEFDLAVGDARDALRRHREQGGGVLVRTRAGGPDAVGADGHPAARDEVAPGDGLTTAPADWLWGAPLG